MGLNELVTNDLEVVRIMSGARSTYKWDAWYLGARLDAYHDNMFLLLDAASHDKAKARTFGAYSGRELPQLEHGIDDQITKLVDVIRGRYVATTPGSRTGGARLLDLAQIMSYLTLDVITQAAFGEPFGYLETESDLYGWFENLRQFFPFTALSVNVPYVRNFFYSPLFIRLFGPKTTDKKGIGRLMWAGVPQVVVPMWTDLYNYAQRVESIGVGVYATRGTAPEWTVDGLSDAFLRVVDGGKESVRIRERARLVGDAARADPGRYAAARQVVKLANSGVV